MALSAAAVLVVLLACGSSVGWASEVSPPAALDLDLTKATIQPKLSALPPTDDVLLEFFASWCPACRAFKPEYEKAAAFLQKHSKVHVFRLDCASDPDVCDKYKVSGYPTMYIGKAADAAAAAVPQLTKFDYSLFNRNSAGVVQFVAKHCKLDLVYKQESTEQAAAAVSGSSTAAAASPKALPWTAADVEAATRQLFTSITSFHPTDDLLQRRAALLMLLRLWAAGHPLATCRSGSAALMQQLPQVWPDDATTDPWGTGGTGGTASGVQPPSDVCAVDASTAAAAGAAAAGAGGTAGPPPYVVCKGSKPDSRGFTCGLWLLFHTTAARLPDSTGGALLVSALKGFAQYFFQCEVCRKHFVQITNTTEAAAVRSKREGVLWLWKVHNEVNSRLKQVETKYGHSSTGDPAFPKVQWPTAADCPLCRMPQPQDSSSSSSRAPSSTPQSSTPTQWNEDEVYRFLTSWYGRQAEHMPAGGDAASAAAAAGGSNSGQQQRDGGSAIMQAALEAEEAAAGSGARSWLPSGRFGVVVLLVVVLGVVLTRQLSGSSGSSSSRRHPGIKGPGMMGYRPKPGHFLPRHGM